MIPAEGELDSGAAQPETKTEGKVAVLEQVMWKRLTDAAELTDFLEAWIALLCRRVPGA